MSKTKGPTDPRATYRDELRFHLATAHGTITAGGIYSTLVSIHSEVHAVEGKLTELRKHAAESADDPLSHRSRPPRGNPGDDQ